MLVLEHDFRWQHIWWFLSLDDTRPFFDELLVRVPDKLLFTGGLRRVLGPLMTDQDRYLSNPGFTSYVVSQWVRQELEPAELNRLLCWADKVFVKSASERSAEWTWSMLVASLNKDPARKSTIPAWISDLLMGLKIEEVRGRNQFIEKLEEQFEIPLSEWDRSALLLRDTTRDSVRTSLALMVKRNIFVRAWAELTSGMRSEALLELYELGKYLAAQYSLDREGVAFPGSWDFELSPLTAGSSR